MEGRPLAARIAYGVMGLPPPPGAWCHGVHCLRYTVIKDAPGARAGFGLVTLGGAQVDVNSYDRGGVYPVLMWYGHRIISRI